MVFFPTRCRGWRASCRPLPSGEHLKYVVQMHFSWEETTNNTAEYEGLLVRLKIAIELGIKKLIICGDSQLVVRQVNKNYQSPLMEAYVEEVRRLEEHFDGLQTEHVPRAENSMADNLSKCATQKLPVEPGTFVLISLSTSYPQQQWPGKGGNWTPVSLSR